MGKWSRAGQTVYVAGAGGTVRNPGYSISSGNNKEVGIMRRRRRKEAELHITTIKNYTRAKKANPLR
ncbi:hypothetical protein SUGI_1171410 [Cryptomeria japonica]|nr:hypothetical protein SUGI_1171410 [Cryptomeria japonica]